MKAENSKPIPSFAERQNQRVEMKLNSRRVKPLGSEHFEVPSSRGGVHLVSCARGRWTCSDCVHFNAATGPCDHILMVRRFMQDGQPADLQPEQRIARTQTVRNWSQYKSWRRQAPEAIELMLRDLCAAYISGTSVAEGPGRPRLPMSDVIQCINARRMVRSSALEATSLVRSYHARGLLQFHKAPHEDSISLAMREDTVSTNLGLLTQYAADHLCSGETTLAIDAQSWRTPFSMYQVNVLDQATRTHRLRKANFTKLQVILGLRYKIVAGVAVLSEEDGEPGQTVELLEQAIGRFRNVKMFLGDNAYMSLEIFRCLAGHCITSRVPFRSNSTPLNDGSAWDINLAEFLAADEEFWADYFARLCVESYFGALRCMNGHVKRLKSKLMKSQAAELLSMVLNYQLRMVLIAHLREGMDIPWLGSETRRVIGKLGRTAITTEPQPDSPDAAHVKDNLILFPSRRPK